MKRVLVLGFLLVVGCYKSTQWVSLSGPQHLGDGDFGGQSFDHKLSELPMYCSRVTLPKAADTTVMLSELRNTEWANNVLLVDGDDFMLPMVLAQHKDGGSTGASMSPQYKMRLSQGQHSICVMAGLNEEKEGDLDDFEFDALLLQADGISTRRIVVQEGSPADVLLEANP